MTRPKTVKFVEHGARRFEVRLMPQGTYWLLLWTSTVSSTFLGEYANEGVCDHVAANLPADFDPSKMAADNFAFGESTR